MQSYLCNHLSYPGHVHGSLTFDALDDDAACEIATAFYASGPGLDYELWQGGRLVHYVRRIRKMETTGVLGKLACSQERAA